MYTTYGDIEGACAGTYTANFDIVGINSIGIYNRQFDIASQLSILYLAVRIKLLAILLEISPHLLAEIILCTVILVIRMDIHIGINATLNQFFLLDRTKQLDRLN